MTQNVNLLLNLMELFDVNGKDIAIGLKVSDFGAGSKFEYKTIGGFFVRNRNV